jgi:methylphosphotriester-DNA--protein-cysteine methyltransferase
VLWPYHINRCQAFLAFLCDGASERGSAEADGLPARLSYTTARPSCRRTLIQRSTYYFARLFRQATGETPHRFLLRLRIERAQELLATHVVSLTQIATDVGFADQSHFTRVFKQFVGVTPRAYRRECAG